MSAKESAWSQGPSLDRLMRRLAECPQDFLARPRLAGTDGVHVDAVVSDLIRDLGGTVLTRARADSFRSETIVHDKEENLLSLVLVAAWLLHDPWFAEHGGLADQAFHFLRDGLYATASLVKASRFVEDGERREELVRLCLAGLGLLPRGETKHQALDRLNTVSSAERQKVVQDTKARIQRAKELKKKMEEQRAREAAAKSMRE